MNWDVDLICVEVLWIIRKLLKILVCWYCGFAKIEQ